MIQIEVPFIFSSNNYFVPYMSVMFASILEHMNPNNKYHIIILHKDISLEYQYMLEKQIEQKHNFSIRFIDVSEQVSQYSFYTANRMFFTMEAYYRLLAPFLLPEYDKAIYMDGDMVALKDVGLLNTIDLGTCLVGAVRDFCGLSDLYDANSDRKAYMHEILELKNSDDYYISGLLIMNLKEFRRKFTLDQIMELATSRDWKYHDQDILNILTEQNTLLLDARWNVLQDYGMHHLMPAKYYEEWKQSQKDPFIIHFGGDAKPWRFPRVPHSNLFWEYARKTPFYDIIIKRRKEELSNNSLYRLKYYLQYLFPLGSKSRIIVKSLTKPIWRLIKERYQ